MLLPKKVKHRKWQTGRMNDSKRLRTETKGITVSFGQFGLKAISQKRVKSNQIEAARNFYNRAENKGFCPPGLAKKGTGCLPPGQAKKWKKGESLPANLMYYELPRSVMLALGVPPQGYKYVRVATDILLIAIGSNMVMDAIEDLVQ